MADDRTADEAAEAKWDYLERHKLAAALQSVVCNGLQLGFDGKTLRGMFDVVVATVESGLQSDSLPLQAGLDRLRDIMEEKMEKLNNSPEILQKKKPQ